MSKEFLNRIMVKNASTKADTITCHPINKETLGPLERTIYRGKERPGQHFPTKGEVAPGAFSATYGKASRVDPHEFQLSHTGRGGTSNTLVALEVNGQKSTSAKRNSPPKGSSTAPRPNPPNTELRRFYERGDLPIKISQAASKAKIVWTVEISDLDFHHYLPIFVSGLRELEFPYAFIGEQGCMDMVQQGGEDKVLPVVPQLIVPLKEALSTRIEPVVMKGLRLLTALAQLGPRVGAALVPYYRQLLPVCAALGAKRVSTGDQTDFAQRKGNLNDTIAEVLNALEVSGGEDAYINIKYVVPTYESAIIG